MQCPYCAEEIKDEAIACKHCGRDFFVIQPLMAQLKDASERIEELESRLIGLGADPNSNETAKPPAITQRAAVMVAAVDARIPSLPLWATFALAVLILVFAHFLIIVQFDLPLIFLRVVSIAFPLVLGFLYRSSLERRLLWDLCTGLAIAVISILIMSVIVAKVDRVPIMPQDAQGWREYAEYAASIGFGFFAGCVLRHGLMVARSPSPRVSFAVELISRFIEKKLRGKDGEDDDKKPSDAVDVKLKKIETLVSGAIAAGSVAVSIYTGLSGLIRGN